MSAIITGVGGLKSPVNTSKNRTKTLELKKKQLPGLNDAKPWSERRSYPKTNEYTYAENTVAYKVEVANS